MALKLGVYCDANRVSALDTDTQLGFTLLLSATLIRPKDDVSVPDRTEFAKVWSRALDKARVWKWDAGANTWSKLFDAQVIAWPTKDEKVSQDVAKGLIKTIDERNAAELVISEDEWTQPPKTDDVEYNGGAAAPRVPVKDLLAELATQPYPVPQHLRLSWAVRIDRDGLVDGDRLLIAPHFDKGNGTAFDVTLDAAAQVPGAALHYVKYESKWCGLTASVGVKPPDTGWIQSNGWVHRAGQRAWSDDDFVRLVETAWAELSDVGTQLREVLRDSVFPTGVAVKLKQWDRSALSTTEDANLLAALPRIALALVRTRFRVGVRLAGEAPAALRDLGDEVDLPTPARKALEKWEAKDSTDLTLKAWQSLLRAAVPEPQVVDRLFSPAPNTALGVVVQDWLKLSAALDERETLAAVIRAQWEAALVADSAVDEKLQGTVLGDLDRLLADPAFDLVDRTRLLTARPAFSTVIGEIDATTLNAGTAVEVRNALAKAAAEDKAGTIRAATALELLPDAFLAPGDRTVLAEAKLVGAMADRIRAAVVAIAKKAGWDRTGDDAKCGPGTPTDVPHAVAIPVVPDGVESPADAFEFYQGFGLLMRRVDDAGEGKWRSLNVARLIGDSTHYEDGKVTVVPLRLGYVEGLKQTHVSYANHPLAAKSPAKGMTLQGLKAWRGYDGDLDVEEPIRREPVDVGGADVRAKWGLLPGLAFGANYEVAVFGVANGGVLPKRLQDGTEPWKLPAVRGATDPPRDAIQPICYRRRVPFGAPRILKGVGPGASAERVDDLLPPVPDHVAPRAAELTEAEAKRIEPPTGSALDERPPIVLLTPTNEAPWGRVDRHDRTKLTLDLGQPATNLLTWDAQKAFNQDPSTSAERKLEWGAHYKAVRDKTESPTFVDPAATGYFLVQWIDVSDGTVHKDIVSGECLRVHLSLTESASARAGCSPWSPKDGTLEGIHLLRVQSVYDPTHFHSDIRNHGKLEDHVAHNAPPNSPLVKTLTLLKTAGISTPALGPPFDLLVEVAKVPCWAVNRTKRLQYERALFEAIRFETPTGAGAEHPNVDVLLRKPTGKVAEIVEDTSDYFVDRQIWRWDGRLQPRFPFAEAVEKSPRELLESNRYQEWVATAFATRPDHESIRYAGTLSHLDAFEPAAGKTPKVLLNVPRGTDPEAKLFRFGLRARSRYAGLLSLAASDEVELAARHRLGDKQVRTQWHPLFDGSRRTQPLPRPRVKLVVPLTQSSHDQATGEAPLLVVLNEPWYEACGIAEDLQVEVIRASVWEPYISDAPPPADTPIFELPEFGPDPIWSSEAWRSDASDDPANPKDAPTPPDEDRHVSFEPRGPVGYTFDTDSSAPLFSSSGFFLERPRVPEWAVTRDLSWHMGKIRFWRHLNPEGRADYATVYPRREDPIELPNTQSAAPYARPIPNPGRGHRLLFQDVRALADNEVGTVATFGLKSAARELSVSVRGDGVLQVSGTGYDGSVLVGHVRLPLDLAFDIRRAGEESLSVTVLARSSGERSESKVAHFEPDWVEVVAVTWPLAAGLPECSVLGRDLGAAFYVRVDGSKVGVERIPIPVPLLESEATAPVPVQLLPDSGAWRATDADSNSRLTSGVSDLRVVLAQVQPEPRLHVEQRTPLGWEPVTIGANGAPLKHGQGFVESHCFLLVTSIISDARGREDEKFHALVSIAQGTAAVDDVSRDLRARLVEVHRVATVMDFDPKKIFQELFPDRTDDSGATLRVDAQARIVRVSEPIGVSRRS